MTGETPYGFWERLADGPYELDRSITAENYRWHAPARFCPFSIDFQATESRPARRFYPTQVLAALRELNPADDYVESVCRFGIGLLPEMEKTLLDLVEVASAGAGTYANKVLPTRNALEFLFSLFQTRRTGHARVTRKFNRWDDFTDTTNSVYRPETLVPGINLPRRSHGSSGTDVIHLIQEVFVRTVEQPNVRLGRADRLDVSAHRTPLDQILVQGIFRENGDPKTLSFSKIIESIAPALIDGIEVENDSQYLARHADDFRYFVSRLAKRHHGDAADFGSWLQQESEKGFIRLFPGFKHFDKTAREAAREKGRRFYRRVLWTAYEVMSRCYGAAALWMWVSFCQSRVVTPSTEEEQAFRWYHAPLVCTGGLPLWFFGPNVLRWILEPFIACVWGLRPDQEFDALTRLIGLYGQVAAERRRVDNDKKHKANLVRHSGLHTRDLAEQYHETADGKNVKVTVPTVKPVLPRESATTTPKYTESTVCPCGGQLVPARDAMSEREVRPTITDREIFVDVECVECGKELIYRIDRPKAQ